jgi:hypothetical protein
MAKGPGTRIQNAQRSAFPKKGIWLIPPMHFRAMLDGRLYALMNWSMVLDGLLFWSLVLDRQPKRPARTSYGVRAALALGVIFPQIVLGVIIGFSTRDLYSYYDLCGRLRRDGRENAAHSRAPAVRTFHYREPSCPCCPDRRAEWPASSC